MKSKIDPSEVESDQPVSTLKLDLLISSVYGELRRIAHRRMNDERRGHTLQTTALVNEAYLRLRELDRIEWRDRQHFLSVAAGIMRRVLVDQARARNAGKRGGDAIRITLDEHNVSGGEDGVDLIQLDAALDRLARQDETQARIVELRYFTGLSIDETAQTLSLSPATIKRKWTLAQACLYQELRSSL